MSTITRRTLALAAVASLGLVACGSDDSADDSGADDTEQTDGEAVADAEGVTMADPWSRQPAEGQTNSAVYGVLTNETDETIIAIAASTSVSDTVELHEVLTNDEGQMTMQEKDGGYEIAAGESLTFEPGGPHIMVLDIDPATYPETVDVTLTFDNDTALDFTAEVRDVADMEMDMDMDDSEMDDMDDSEMDEMDDSES